MRPRQLQVPEHQRLTPAERRVVKIWHLCRPPRNIPQSRLAFYSLQDHLVRVEELHPISVLEFDDFRPSSEPGLGSFPVGLVGVSLRRSGKGNWHLTFNGRGNTGFGRDQLRHDEAMQTLQTLPRDITARELIARGFETLY